VDLRKGQLVFKLKRYELDIKKPYIIGETAYNHEGAANYLYKMIDEIAEIKLNAIKFHLLLNPNSYMTENHPLKKEIDKWIFKEQEWEKIINYSLNKNLDVIALCDDVESIEYINKNRKDIFAIEIHATGINDIFLLKKASQFKGIVILGIGGSSIDEIEYAINFLKKEGKNDIILMYGFQSFPTDYNEINLSKMVKIKELFDLPVGYADHTGYDDPNNEIISVMGAMMGVNILEKHYTLNPGEKRIDNLAAVGKKQMVKIKDLMKIALQVYGEKNIQMSENEKAYGNIGPMKKAIVAKNTIKKGEKITLDKIWFKRTKQESTLKQNQLLSILDQKASKNIAKDEIIDFSNINYRFKKPDLKILGLK